MPSILPLNPDEVALITDDAGIEAELKQRGLWPKFLACREAAWHNRRRTGPWGWCLMVADPAGGLSLFIGLVDYPVPADNGYLWYSLAHAQSQAGIAELSAILTRHFPNADATQLRTLAPGEVGSLN
jgi:hypothetical protein